MSSEVFNSTSILETSKVLRLVDTGLEKLVDTGGSRLTYLAAPKDAKDAVNKEYLEGTLKGAKEEFDAIKTSVDEAKGDIDIKHSEVNKNATDVKAIKVELQEHLESVGNKELIVTQKAQEVEALKISIESMKEAIDLTSSSIDSSKDEIAQNIETIQDIQEELNTQANQFRDDVARFGIKLETALKNVEKNLTDTTNQHIEIDGKFIELRSITSDTKNELETLNQQLTDTANNVKDEISTIKLDVLNKVSNAKHSIEMSIIQANTISQALTHEANGAYDVLDALNNDDLADEIYLLKGEIIHTNAKLSANRLSLAIKQGATMAYRIKYELELPSLAELKDEYQSSNELAKDRLDKLDLMLNEADIMIRNSQFYNYLGVMI